MDENVEDDTSITQIHITSFIVEIIGVRLIILFSELIAICGMIIFYYATALSNIDEKLSNLNS